MLPRRKLLVKRGVALSLHPGAANEKGTNASAFIGESMVYLYHMSDPSTLHHHGLNYSVLKVFDA